MAQKIRRYDLDWLRVLVFGLLIIYHVGMFFVPWDWHLKNNITYDWLEYPMLFVNQWRLSILFVISGMGTCFALAYRSGNTFATERLKRLGIPLLVGVFLIVPPQVYVERLVDGSFQGSYAQFYLSLEAFNGIYPSGNISWHHLWFLPYLLLFSLILTPVFLFFRESPNHAIIRWLRQQLQNPFGLYLFMLPLFLTEVFLAPYFPVTHALIGDWFTLFNFLILFFYGYLFIRLGKNFWTAIDKLKSTAFIIGIISFTAFLFLQNTTSGFFESLLLALVKVVNCWSWIIVLFGYAAKFLNRKSSLLSYCNTAVYPFYILHQTITVLLAYYLMNWRMNFGLKFMIMTVGTFFISWVLYEFVIRRIPFLAPLFGLKKKATMPTNLAFKSV